MTTDDQPLPPSSDELIAACSQAREALKHALPGVELIVAARTKQGTLVYASNLADGATIDLVNATRKLIKERL